MSIDNIIMKPLKGITVNPILLKLKSRINQRLQSDGSEAGVGLIEMLVALAILAIGLVGFIGVYVAVGKATKMAADRQAAINIAAQQLSQLEGFESLNWEYSGNIPSSVLNSTATISGVPFTSVTSVTNCTGTGAAYISATVKVSWKYGPDTYDYTQTVQLTPSSHTVGVSTTCP